MQKNGIKARTYSEIELIYVFSLMRNSAAFCGRTFERRYGTSRFFTYLLTSFIFSTCIEAAVTFALTCLEENPLEFTGLLAVGP